MTRGPRDNDPLIDGVEQIRPLLRQVGRAAGLPDGTQPLDSSLRVHPRRGGLIESGAFGTELINAAGIGTVGELLGDVLQGELAHLTFDAGTIDRDWPNR